jgi:hypothetical protein
VVEDVVTSGGQVVTSTGQLREAGAVVFAAVCVIDRQSGGEDALRRIELPLVCLLLSARNGGLRPRELEPIVPCLPAGRAMTEHISSWGKSAAAIRAAAGVHVTSKSVCVRVTILDFQDLIDDNGHVVRLDLPGSICGDLRRSTGCTYAEVLHTENLSDAEVIALFEGSVAADRSIEGILARTFQLEHLALPCPPLAVTRGPIDQILGLVVPLP